MKRSIMVIATLLSAVSNKPFKPIAGNGALRINAGGRGGVASS
jgi:hypothetical protein